MAHDAARGIKGDVYIGANCFIGIASIILPGYILEIIALLELGRLLPKIFQTIVLSLVILRKGSKRIHIYNERFNSLNMEIKDFVQNFADQFDDTEADLFTAGTKFRELEEWSSLITLSIIAMVDEIYGVEIKADDLRKAETIGDLFEIVCAKG